MDVAAALPRLFSWFNDGAGLAGREVMVRMFSQSSVALSVAFLLSVGTVQVARGAEDVPKTVETKQTIVLQVAGPDAAGKPQRLELKKLDGGSVQVYTVRAEGEGKEGDERKTMTVTVVPGDGEAKHKQIRIQELKAGGLPMKVQVHRLEASSAADLGKQWPKIEEQLKAAGLDEKKIAEIRAAMDKAAKSAEGGKRAFGVAVAQAEGIAATDRFMIGVACSPVGEALRAQLKLDPHAGLVVDSVFDDSPAKKAGVQPHDILLEVDAKKVQKPQDLVAAVQQAAKDKKPVVLTLLRSGEKKTVEVSPAERPEITLSFHVASDQHVGSRVIAIGPGVITAPGTQLPQTELKALAEKLEQLSKQVKELQEAVKKLQKGN